MNLAATFGDWYTNLVETEPVIAVVTAVLIILAIAYVIKKVEERIGGTFLR